MKKQKGLYDRLQKLAGVLVLVAVLAAGLSMDAFKIISHAESTGKITANTAKVRQEASTSSNTLASVSKGNTVTVKGQTQASDGHIWYQVVYNGDQTGYIRGDLMEITDGSTPGNIVASTTGQTTEPAQGNAGDESVVEVVDVQPVSASVSGTSPVRVRQNASTTSRIVSTAQGGLAMTVTGTASGTDGNEWYRVNFISNGSEVTGFIRADYVALDGELVAGVEGGEGGEAVEQPAEQVTENEYGGVDGSKDWDTFYQDDIWHLVDNTSGKSYSIPQIFETVETNNNTLKEVLATNKTQQIIVVVLVIVVVLLICAISVMFFKFKELKDDAYYESVENETIRRRSADRAGQSGNGAKAEGNGGRRPAPQRAEDGGNAHRQAGERNNGRRSEGARPEGRRPEGARPEGQRSERQGAEGQRPAGSGKKRRPVNGAESGQRRPAEDRRREERPADDDRHPAERRTVVPERVKRPHVQDEADKVREAAKELEEETEDIRENVQESADSITENIEQAAKEVSREIEAETVARSAVKPKWKSKNFADDDEFEFQFLDWDDDQE